MSFVLHSIQSLIIVAFGLTAFSVHAGQLDNAITVETATNNAAIQSQKKLTA